MLCKRINKESRQEYVFYSALFWWKKPYYYNDKFFLFFFLSDHRPHRVYTTFYRLHSFTCTRHYNSLYSVYGEPSGQRFESLLQPETFSAIFSGTAALSFFRHCGSQFFLALCAFFSIFFAFKGCYIQVSLIFRSKLKCQKTKMVSPFMYCGTMRLFNIFIFRFVSKI